MNVILAMLGSIGGLLWLIELFRKKVQSRAFFSLFPSNQEVVIVVPSLGQSGPNITMTFEDALACATVQAEFIRHAIPYRVRLHTQVSNEDRAANLFVIGGEVVNQVMAAAASAIRLAVRAEPTPSGTQIRDHTGHVVHPAIRGGETDCAMIGVLRNPWSDDPYKRVYVAAGAEGIGTWAAALQLTTASASLLERLRALNVSPKDYFQAIFDVRVNGHQRPTTFMTRAFQVA